ncbi:MAG: ABC transporter permease [Acidobacteria bacterium]|nr:ABC transporter permease [Acidobacteriota bacterium]
MFFKDTFFAFRMLFKNPVVNGIAILSLALGIGASTAIFTLTSSLFLSSLPYLKDPDRLIKVYSKTPFSDYGSISYLDYRDFREGNKVFSDLVAYGAESLSLDLGAAPQRIRANLVSGNYFSALGVRPAAGRGFAAEEDRRGAPLVAVLSHGLWQSGFGSEPSAIGKTVRLNGKAFTVVGVAPAQFRGVDMVQSPDVWIPLAAAPEVLPQGPLVLESRGFSLWRLVGRLKPGAGLEQARADLGVIARRLNHEFPARFPREPVLLPAGQASFSPSDRGAVSRQVAMLMTVVGLVLLIACVNITNLVLARTSRRRRELSVRQALGADRGRLVRQLLTETTLLSLIGAGLGLLVARALLPLLARYQLPAKIALDLELDGRVLAFGIALGLVTGVLVGLAPAFRASRPDLVSALKDTGTRSEKVRRLGLQSLFVVAQVSLSLLLLIGAGLFLKSLQQLRTVDPGVKPNHLAMVSIDLGAAGYSEERGKAFYQQLLERAGHLPGVESASLGSSLPIQSQSSALPFFSSDNPAAAEGVQISINLIAPRYFETIGLPLVQGRDFRAADAGSPSVGIVNQTLARRFWPGQDPIGKRLRFGRATGPLIEVVGVARDGKYSSLREEPQSFIYLPYLQVYEMFDSTKHLLVRTAVEPAQIFSDLQRQVLALDRSLPIFDAQTMESYLGTFLAQERQTAVLLLLLSGLALLLASVGLYGVMSYSVAQRTREIGIRMAIGADRGRVLRQLVAESARLVAVGSVLGLAVALLATRVVSSLLYGVSPTDAGTFVLAFVVLGTVGLLAGFFPARRASSIHPMTAIRYD